MPPDSAVAPPPLNLSRTRTSAPACAASIAAAEPAAPKPMTTTSASRSQPASRIVELRLPAPVGGDVGAVRARGAAEPPRPVLGQVHVHALAVAGRAQPQPVKLARPDHIG